MTLLVCNTLQKQIESPTQFLHVEHKRYGTSRFHPLKVMLCHKSQNSATTLSEEDDCLPVDTVISSEQRTHQRILGKLSSTRDRKGLRSELQSPAGSFSARRFFHSSRSQTNPTH